MMNSSLLTLLLVLTLTGCATAQPSPAPPAPVRLDELVVLGTQGRGDDAVIAEIERRGVAFVLSAQDMDAQRAAGVSDGVLRYLQGRASADRDLQARLQGARYRVPAYSGALYLGYPYIGYGGGAHFYGYSHDDGGHRDHPGRYPGGHSAGHIGAPSGGHHGGRH